MERPPSVRPLHGPLSSLPVLVLGIALSNAGGCERPSSQPGEGSATGDPTTGAAAELPPGAQARSFLGETLFPPPLTPELREQREADLAEADAEREAAPGSAEAWIWVGRRQAYLGLYREAIATFSEGLERFPDDARLLRHRGHRLLTVREPDRAEADLLAGLELAREHPDEIEPDGLPNALGIPLSTLQFNLWYHLGLARYVQADWEGAAEAWEACMEVSENPDLRVATSYWLYLTRRRLGRDAEAEELLADLPQAEEIIENDSYLALLRLYRGDADAQELLESEDPGSLGGATLAYGVAMHHLTGGREDSARAVFQRILDSPEQWPAFGYLAAEAEVARRGW